MRGDRLIQILLLLQTHGKLSAKQLAERLEVSERTIHRDMDALSSAGIPVVAERGQGGGWSLLDNYHTDLTGLKDSEIRSLLISQSTQMLEDVGLAGPLHEAKLKLLASLSADKKRASAVWNRIHIDTSTWRNRKEKVAAFETLKEAVWHDYALHINYERADGTITERTVGPLGLVAKGSRWYLIACGEDGEVRTYRASRIHAAEIVNEPFIRPAHFDLAQYWQSSTQSFIKRMPSYEITAWASSAVLHRLTFSGFYIQDVQFADEQPRLSPQHSRIDTYWSQVKLTFDTEAEALSYLLGLGDQIRVIEPRHLQDQIAEMAERIVHFYS